jgi:hypothetical protein
MESELEFSASRTGKRGGNVLTANDRRNASFGRSIRLIAAEHM